ncbi:hypothetical protein D0T12_33900 [Actinomadura spongiicola]|uniref:Uncharacterized protein n=1 Tax=Actinomadura spongiicola TaxID=2303421 RepID=A0A372G7M4_9ACTN|nr:hypothetical protein [Actinomadura spongiicola]RFS81149.1 hypothetical protein D0T12_33900 [Actinomadura spongiicola]
MDFSSAADELYGVRPAEFVATRKRLVEDAKAAGDAPLAKRVGALRRPTLSAWAVNLLARSAADELGRLLDVGDEIRAAWGSGGGLGDLEQRRARLVGSLVRTAGDLAADAGNPLREQAVREVEDTLQAATVDAGIADEVRAGRLAQPRSHTGFVPAGFPLAPREGKPPAEPEPASEEKPPPDAKPKKKAAPERARSNVTRTSAARARRAETLRRRADEADRKLTEREERADAAKREAADASARVGRLRHELEQAVAERDAADRRAERAEENRARAEVAAREAREAAREARRAADRDARHG